MKFPNIPLFTPDPNASLTKKTVRMVVAFGSASVLFIFGASLLALAIAKAAVGPAAPSRPGATGVGTISTSTAITPPDSTSPGGPSSPRKPQSI